MAFALVFPGNDLPRLVHWGRPLAAPATVIDMFDAQMPQRVSGTLDYTSWPSVLPTQSESWIGATRFDVRRDGVELFCKFAVSNITAETVAAGKTYVMGEKDGCPNWSVADEPKQDPTVTVTAEDAEQHVKLIWTCELDEPVLFARTPKSSTPAKAKLEVGKVELAFTVPADANEILTTTGHHLRERSPAAPGLHPLRQSIHGRTSRLRCHPAVQRRQKGFGSRTATSIPHTWHGAATACSPRNVCPTPAV